MIVYAKKGEFLSTFTKFLWDNMGKNKNGWEIITKNQYEACKRGEDINPSESKKAVNEIASEKAYKELTKKAADLVVEEDFEKALELLHKAQKLKPSSYIKGRITSVTNALQAQKEEQETEEQVAELLELAKTFEDENDWEQAHELYQDIYKISKTEKIAAKIQECAGKLSTNE